MVVKMKKLQALIYHMEKERFLKSLRDLGVVQIVEKEENESEHLREIEDVERMGERVVAALKRIASDLPQWPEQEERGEALGLIHDYRKYESELEKADQELLALRKHEAALEQWGEFSPQSVRRLGTAGVYVRFFRAPEKVFEEIARRDIIVEPISQKDKQVCFVAVSRDQAFPLPEAEEIRLPDFSLSEVRARMHALQMQRARDEENVRRMTSSINHLEKLCVQMRNRSRYERARQAMQEQVEGKVVSLSGWFAAENEEAVKEIMGQFPAWYSLRDPVQGDNVPVLLKNGRLGSLYQPITKLFSLPDYFEIDPTPFLAPFFTFFFGLCLGDLGYGFVLLLAATAMTIFAPHSFKSMGKLMMILGIVTIGAGLLLNTAFGATLFHVPGDESGFFKSGGWCSVLSPCIRDGIQVFPAMTLCLYIAFVQLFLGMVLQTVNRVREGGTFTHALQPVAGMALMTAFALWLAKANFMEMQTFRLGPLAVGAAFASLPDLLCYGLIIVGLALMLLFNSLDRTIWVRPALGLWELYQFASGLVGNGLSYLRLFALGLAGGLLGMSFNQIAMGFITENGVIVLSWKVVLSVLLIVLGHALILGLSMIGAFAHPLRLTFVEFYSSVQFKGGGKPFSPFAEMK